MQLTAEDDGILQLTQEKLQALLDDHTNLLEQSWEDDGGSSMCNLSEATETSSAATANSVEEQQNDQSSWTTMTKENWRAISRRVLADPTTQDWKTATEKLIQLKVRTPRQLKKRCKRYVVQALEQGETRDNFLPKPTENTQHLGLSTTRQIKEKIKQAKALSYLGVEQTPSMWIVLDTGCSKMLAGLKAVKKYLRSIGEDPDTYLEQHRAEADTLYSFAGGGQQRAAFKLPLPIKIFGEASEHEVDILEQEGENTPLLISSEILEKQNIIVDLAGRKIYDGTAGKHLPLQDMPAAPLIYQKGGLPKILLHRSEQEVNFAQEEDALVLAEELASKSNDQLADKKIAAAITKLHEAKTQQLYLQAFNEHIAALKDKNPELDIDQFAKDALQTVKWELRQAGTTLPPEKLWSMVKTTVKKKGGAALDPVNLQVVKLTSNLMSKLTYASQQKPDRPRASNRQVNHKMHWAALDTMFIDEQPYLVYVNMFTRFGDVHECVGGAPTARDTLEFLDKLSNYGLLTDNVLTDQGPEFANYQVAQRLAYEQVHHWTSAAQAHWTNGMVERRVRTLREGYTRMLRWIQSSAWGKENLGQMLGSNKSMDRVRTALLYKVARGINYQPVKSLAGRTPHSVQHHSARGPLHRARSVHNIEEDPRITIEHHDKLQEEAITILDEMMNSEQFRQDLAKSEDERVRPTVFRAGDMVEVYEEKWLIGDQTVRNTWSPPQIVVGQESPTTYWVVNPENNHARRRQFSVMRPAMTLDTLRFPTNMSQLDLQLAAGPQLEDLQTATSEQPLPLPPPEKPAIKCNLAESTRSSKTVTFSDDQGRPLETSVHFFPSEDDPGFQRLQRDIQRQRDKEKTAELLDWYLDTIEQGELQREKEQEEADLKAFNEHLSQPLQAAHHTVFLTKQQIQNYAKSMPKGKQMLDLTEQNGEFKDFDPRKDPVRVILARFKKQDRTIKLTKKDRAWDSVAVNYADNELVEKIWLTRGQKSIRAALGKEADGKKLLIKAINTSTGEVYVVQNQDKLKSDDVHMILSLVKFQPRKLNLADIPLTVEQLKTGQVEVTFDQCRQWGIADQMTIAIHKEVEAVRAVNRCVEIVDLDEITGENEQKRLRTAVTSKLVLTIKLEHGKTGQVTVKKCKARWVARGFQDRRGHLVEGWRTDSETVSELGLKAVLQFAAHHNLRLRTYDFETAFLQSEYYNEQEKKVYLKLPTLLQNGQFGFGPKSIGLVHKSLYGLQDAPAEWQQKLIKTLVQAGFRQSISDPCVLIFEQNKEKKDNLPTKEKDYYAIVNETRFHYPEPAKIRAVICVHVDDAVIAADEHFFREPHLWPKIAVQVKATDPEFADKEGLIYCGRRIKQCDKTGKVTLDQGHYAEKIEEHTIAQDVQDQLDQGKSVPFKEKLANGKCGYQSTVGTLRWVTGTRADILFELSVAASEANTPTYNGVRMLNSCIKKVKKRNMITTFEKLPRYDVHAICDASFGNRGDKQTQQGIIVTVGHRRAGQHPKHAAMETNNPKAVEQTEHLRAIPILWKSGKQARRAQSTAGAELIALRSALALAKYTKGMLVELGLSKNSDKIYLISDANDVVATVQTVKKPREPNLQADYAQLRWEVKAGWVVVEHVHGPCNAADVLTKDPTSKNTRNFDLLYLGFEENVWMLKKSDKKTQVRFEHALLADELTAVYEQEELERED